MSIYSSPHSSHGLFLLLLLLLLARRYLKASSLRNKKELLEELNSANAPPPDPVVAEMQKIQFEQAMAKTEAEIEDLRASALKKRVEADVADAQLGVVMDPTIVKADGSPPQPSVPAAGVNPGAPDQPPPGITGV